MSAAVDVRTLHAGAECKVVQGRRTVRAPEQILVALGSLSAETTDHP